MDTDYSLWMDTLINKLEREARYRREGSKGPWVGYSDEISTMSGAEEAFRDSLRRRERMAEACYDV
tara:strand:+ start:93 stop:290 length:198 start_codon:yes stop_codon:yes gene_type:complete